MAPSSIIDLEQPLCHEVRVQMAEGSCHPCPLPVLKLLGADPDITAICIEYLVIGEDDLVYPTLPLHLWRGNADELRDLNLTRLSRQALAILEEGLTSYEGPSSFGSLTPFLLDALQSKARAHSLHRWMAVFMRTATFLLPSQIGDQLEDIDGQSYETDKELAEIMRSVRGDIILPPSSDRHAALKTFALAGDEAAIFDALFHELTGVTISTSLVAPLGLRSS